MSKGRQDEAEASEGAKWLAEERITREDLVLSTHPHDTAALLGAPPTLHASFQLSSANADDARGARRDAGGAAARRDWLFFTV